MLWKWGWCQWGCSRSGNGGEERCHYLVLLLIILNLLRARQVRLSFRPQTLGFLGGRGCQVTTAVPQLKEITVGSPGSC